MRLTCPNCSARYEVADTMIPPEGRDVQCSNCSTTWFQPGRRTDRSPAVSIDRTARAAPPPSPPPAEAVIPQRTTAAPPPPPQDPAPAPVAEAPEPEATAPAETAAPPRPPRREIDPAVRDILRAEAEREARLRQAEAEPVETQAEMSLPVEPEDAARARRRAELDAAVDAFAPEAAAGPAGRRAAQAARDLFPDIDQINSTLRDTGDRSGQEADASDIDTLDAAPRRRRGVRLGFILVLSLAAGGAALYANAERVAVQVPALAPAMAGYVGAVDAARFWLDGVARSIGADAGET